MGRKEDEYYADEGPEITGRLVIREGGFEGRGRGNPVLNNGYNASLTFLHPPIT